jgi:hypothetical protein
MTDPGIEQVVASYGLREFPYKVRELNPLEDEGDLTQLCWVDGWNDARALDGFLEERAQAREPAVVVVAGGSGTGRSSLVNWLLHTWARHRQVDLAKLVIARKRAASLHAEEQLWGWALSLEPKLEGAGIRMADATERVFSELLARRPDAVAASVRRFLGRLTVDLDDGGAALAGVIDRVEDPTFLSLASECIAGVNTLLVLTVVATPATEAGVLDQQQKFLDPAVGRLVRLRELSGSEVITVVQHRWSRYAAVPGNPSPFSDQALEAAFDQPRRSMREVFLLMTALLVNKAAGMNERWPEASRLRFGDDELVQRMPYVDGWWLRK